MNRGNFMLAENQSFRGVDAIFNALRDAALAAQPPSFQAAGVQTLAEAQSQVVGALNGYTRETFGNTLKGISMAQSDVEKLAQRMLKNAQEAKFGEKSITALADIYAGIAHNAKPPGGVGRIVYDAATRKNIVSYLSENIEAVHPVAPMNWVVTGISSQLRRIGISEELNDFVTDAYAKISSSSHPPLPTAATSTVKPPAAAPALAATPSAATSADATRAKSVAEEIREAAEQKAAAFREAAEQRARAAVKPPTPPAPAAEAAANGGRKWFQMLTHSAEGKYSGTRTGVTAAAVAAVAAGGIYLSTRHPKKDPDAKWVDRSNSTETAHVAHR